MQIRTKYPITIYRKEFGNKICYSTRISKKDKEGNYQNAFIPVQFKKDINVEDRSKIMIMNGWLDFYINKDNKPVFTIFISEFSTEEGDIFQSFGDTVELDDTFLD